jgi:glycosyltransferase involved in cell wall biosynthesis
MKIYFIGQKGIPAKTGGVERHVEELASRLASRGHEVYAYVRPNYTAETIKEYRGVKLISLPSLATKHLDAISHTLRACFDLTKREVDIIHFHAIGPSLLIWLAKLLKPGVPVVSTFHCQDYYHKKWGFLARTALKLGELSSCHLADKTITVSKSLRDYAYRRYGCLAEYIPNGVSVSRPESVEALERWKLERDGYILVVSRLVRHKGIHHLIKAYKRLQTDKKLVIVGDGAFTDNYVWELKALASDCPGIIFTGNQSGDALAALFANSSLFVQPSETEGLSIALLEAMAYGLPVVASDIPENQEAGGESSHYFISGDHIDLARKISKVLSQPEDAWRQAVAGYERAKTEYDWEAITDSTANLYGRLAKEQVVAAPRLRQRFINFLF